MPDPQPVAPGYARRWPVETARHLWRHAQTYVLLLAIPVLPALFATHDPWRTLAGAALGPFAVRLSFEVAAATLAGPLPTRGYARVLRAAIAGSATELRRHAARIGLLVSVFLLALLLAVSWPGEPAPVLPSGGVGRTVALFLPVAVQLFTGLTLIYGVAPGVRCLPPLLERVHGLDAGTALRLAATAERRNRRAFFFLDQVLHAGVFSVLILAPPLAPLALAALPALVTVAMREMFGPHAPARQAAPRTAPSPVAGISPGAGSLEA